ncbi:MAG: hypothetical protein M1832_005959 [Thelocarpon impressellum]|nr:MAG: hypothetical protein M1832_005959 [Thelocarpon impressellum]
MASKALIPFLVGMMLLTGVCNTLLTKYQDLQCVRDCDSPDPKRRALFEQPVLQTAQMFVGEMGCWLVVGGFALWTRVFASGRGEYAPVGTEDDVGEVADAEEGDEEVPPEAGLPIAKPLILPDETRRPLVGWRVILLGLPACCDIAGTTLMNVGLLFVAASIYQMTRGALVLFVGLFSVLFLHRRLHLYQWVALLVVVLGVAIVGLAGVVANSGSAPASSTVLRAAATLLIREISPASSALRTIIGVLLIAGAQVFTATQFVLEEWILERYALEPLKVVGWEGTFGLLVTVIGMAILHLTVGRTPAGRHGYFDASSGWTQLTSSRPLLVSSFLIMLSIGGFNFFGLSVTRTVSATSRSTIDTCRTLFIWLVSLGLGWESFKGLQIVGFGLLVYGTFLFNGIVRPPVIRWLRSRTGRAGVEQVE